MQNTRSIAPNKPIYATTTRVLTNTLSVHFATVTYPNYQNHHFFILDRTNDAVLSYTIAPETS